LVVEKTTMPSFCFHSFFLSPNPIGLSNFLNNLTLAIGSKSARARVRASARASLAGVSEGVDGVSARVALFAPSPAPRRGALSSSSSGGQHRRRHGEHGGGDIPLATGILISA
jgi:hypothetical protein